MIDRKAFLISGALLVLMLAATAWRLALLPDWTHFPTFGPDRTPATGNSFGLLIAPICIIFVGGTLAFARRRDKATPEAVRSLKRWASPLLILYSAICTALQLFILSRSLGLGLALDPVGVSRTMLVLLAGVLIVFANQMPKLPQVPSRFDMFSLDPARRAQSVRFGARMLVLAGIAVIAVAVFVPLPAKGVPLVFSISAAVVLVSFGRQWQLHREYRRERSGS